MLAKLIGNSVSKSPRPRTKWIPPAPEYLKINVDAVVGGTKKGTGIGVTVHDECGNLKEAEASFLNISYDALVALLWRHQKRTCLSR